VTGGAAQADWNQLERITRALALVSVIIYGVGLLVVNAFLFHLGFSDFDLLKPRFILTGMLFLAVISISTVVPIWTSRQIAATVVRQDESLPRKGAKSAFFLVVLVAPVVACIALFESPWPIAARMYVQNFLLGVLIVEPIPGWQVLPKSVRVWFLQREKLASGRSEVRWVYSFYFLLLCIGIAFMGLACVDAFASRVFPFIPAHIGGSEPRNVRLIVSPPHEKALLDLGVPLTDTNSNITKPVELVFEGNDFYLIQKEQPPRGIHGPIFKLEKEIVVSVMTNP
jgi:hypothetical protein